MKRALFVLSFIVATASAATAQNPSPYAKWKNGPSPDPSFFPIAVWLQSPSNAQRYKDAGFNTYVGLWDGPTEEQLATLKKAGIRVFCEQNAVALKHLDDPVIAGWMHGDEPDNAQELPGKKGYGPPITPDKIVAEYEQLRKADPSRPVMLNLGQGVAWDGWYGRGVRSHHPEDYPLYMKGSDIVSFDIYPVVHDNAEVRGKLEFVANGVDRLVKWSGGNQVVWDCIECTHIGNAKLKATPGQVRYEVWSSIIHGSRGLIYFVHQFAPNFREAALLDDPEMLKAVTDINHQIEALAPVLNSPPSDDDSQVTSKNKDVPVDAMIRRDNAESLYIFAVAMRGISTKGIFVLPSLKAGQELEVVGENRRITVGLDSTFMDDFAPWDVHIYRVPPKSN
ncbi:MAG TPA: hypothetical protein VG733_13385 [Chthoniobacteraceae bacterium]|nr:hypothetical protein [Chthoniobacteraceae bacterium]